MNVSPGSRRSVTSHQCPVSTISKTLSMLNLFAPFFFVFFYCTSSYASRCSNCIITYYQAFALGIDSIATRLLLGCRGCSAVATRLLLGCYPIAATLPHQAANQLYPVWLQASHNRVDLVARLHSYYRYYRHYRLNESHRNSSFFINLAIDAVSMGYYWQGLGNLPGQWEAMERGGVSGVVGIRILWACIRT